MNDCWGEGEGKGLTGNGKKNTIKTKSKKERKINYHKQLQAKKNDIDETNKFLETHKSPKLIQE